MSVKKEQVRKELEKLRIIAKNTGSIVHSVLLNCPKVQELVKKAKDYSKIDEVINEICRKCKDEAICVYCHQEHELKNVAWETVRSVFSQNF